MKRITHIEKQLHNNEDYASQRELIHLLQDLYEDMQRTHKRVEQEIKNQKKYLLYFLHIIQKLQQQKHQNL